MLTHSVKSVWEMVENFPKSFQRIGLKKSEWEREREIDVSFLYVVGPFCINNWIWTDGTTIIAHKYLESFAFQIEVVEFKFWIHLQLFSLSLFECFFFFYYFGKLLLLSFSLSFTHIYIFPYINLSPFNWMNTKNSK